MMTTAHIFSWLRQVQEDPAIHSSAFELAFVLSQHVNRESGTAWPTQETLARAIRASDRTVRTLIDLLVAHGHLQVHHAHGRHKPNTYRPVINAAAAKPKPAEPVPEEENRKSASAQTPEKEEVDFLFSGEKPEASFRHKDEKSGNPLHEKRKSIAGKPEASFLQNQPQELASITTPVFLQKQAASAAGSKLDEDPKAILFGEGLNWLIQATGRSEPSVRTALGTMLKNARDDVDRVLAMVREAKRNNRADPISWIMGRLKAQMPSRSASANAIPSNFKLSKPAARA